VTRRYVLFDKDAGVYLGNALGLGFWSKLDPVGQDAAVTFASPQDAIFFRKQCRQSAEIRPVECAGPIEGGVIYATIEEIVAAGMPAWNPKAIPKEVLS